MDYIVGRQRRDRLQPSQRPLDYVRRAVAPR